MGNMCSFSMEVVSAATTTDQRDADVDYEDGCLPTVPRSRVSLRNGPAPSSLFVEVHALPHQPPHQPDPLEDGTMFPRAPCKEPAVSVDKGSEDVDAASEPDGSFLANPLSNQAGSNRLSMSYPVLHNDTAGCPTMLHPVPAANESGASTSRSSSVLPANYISASLLGTSCTSHISVMSRPMSPQSGVSSSCDARQTQVSFRSYAFVLRPARVLGDEACLPRAASTQECFDEPASPLPSFAPAAAHGCIASTCGSAFTRSVSCHSDVESLCEEVGIAPSLLVPLLPPTSPQRHQIASRRKRSCAAAALSGSRRPHLGDGVSNLAAHDDRVGHVINVVSDR
jgi:hypothetical protein